MRCCIGARVLAFALLAATDALALATGKISGVVTDASTQAPVPKALVTARGMERPVQKSAVADERGAFEIARLPTATYVITVERDGFQKLTSEEVEVEGPEATKVRLQLVRLPPPEPAAEGNPPSRNLPIEYSEELTPPVLVSGPSLEYTPQALERRVEGTMVIRCVITADGTVHGCRVIKSLPFMDRAVVAALEQRKYKPALRAGQPVDVYYTFTLKFALP